MKERIYFGGFYFMLGILLTIIVLSFTHPSQPSFPTTPKVELIIHKDSIYKDSVSNKSKVALNKQVINEPLNDKTLMKELRKNNISHPNIVLAQAKLETGNYTSSILKSHNNLFGLRKGNRYRKFGHWTESVIAYKNLIQSKYKGGNYYAFLTSEGYAEDDSYIEKLKDFV